MSTEDLEWAAETLVEAERRRCVSRVSSLESEEAVAKGENFASDIRRLKMTVVLHSGEVQQRSVIYKAMPATPHRKWAAKKFGSFSKEAKMFTDILSEMETIMREKESHAELLWPECLGVKKRCEGLLFEDLRVRGYKMLDRCKGADFEHARIVVRSLAKFHALAAILRERGDLNIKDRNKPYDLEIMYSVYKQNCSKLAATIETSWEEEWTHYGARLRNLPEVLRDKIIDSTNTTDDDRFLTLIHGDCWLNNILFRYGKDERPEAVRFLDFQVCFYQHPGYDLNFFFQTSLNLQTLHRKYELLQEYHSSLEENLRFFGYEGPVPTFAQTRKYYDDTRCYGLSMALAKVPLVLHDPANAPDMEEIWEKVYNNEEVEVVQHDYNEANYVSIMKHVLKEAEENGLI